ncbi:AAA family ATPase [Cardinium endosymbiont of Tipula unca]|uniref:AAA family ATPase n=1 Tax=Cardinium endosymbiont of Tipula unca TaxID=3066216 RepID=UPI0030CCB8F2
MSRIHNFTPKNRTKQAYATGLINEHNPKEKPKAYDWKKYPVINLDFSGLGNGTTIELKRDIKKSLYDIAKKYNVTSKIPAPQGDDSIQSYYKALVASLIELDNDYQPKIVLLIDEYDSPVISRS